MNSIDPRVMKQLLQLQLLNKVSLFSDNQGTSSTDGSDDFGALLQTLMGQATGDSDSSSDLLTAALGQAGAGTSLSSLSALSKSYSPLQSVDQTSTATDKVPFQDLVEAASKRYGVDSSLVNAVIKQESDFNHQAVSSAGAKGLMQLMDGTGSGFGVTNPFDPQQNIDAGTHFLSNLLKKYDGNEGVALAAYNAGANRIDRLGIRNDQDLSNKLHLLPKETQGYVNKVLNAKSNFTI
nr:lytic transglycosylase domain-containing protein [Paenibacillus aestuarii]